jgi:hypothetical protein
MKEFVEQAIENAIDKHWLPFEFRFIEWEANYKKRFL